MRSVLLLALSPILLAQTGSIEGTAVHAVTGAPMEGVHISVESMAQDSRFGAVSDRAGRFSLTGVPAGAPLMLTADRAGFAYVPDKADLLPGGAPGSTVLILRPGEHVTGYKLPMMPRGTITGRVVDENGEPMPGVQVSARAPGADRGAAIGNTDDRGVYRLRPPAGKYYVVAFPEDSSPPEIRTDGTSPASYWGTLYPSAVLRSGAAVVEVREGADVTGIDIRAIRVVPLRISGMLSGMPPGTHASVRIDFGFTADKIDDMQMMPAAPDGSFAFEKLYPGVYRVSAVGGTGGEVLAAPFVERTLTNSSAEGISLKLEPVPDVRGSVKLPPGITANQVMLISQGARMQFAGPVAPDGTFLLKGVMPGRYIVALGPLGDRGYVESVRLGSKERRDGVVDFPGDEPGAKLQIVANAPAGEIRGTLVSGKGDRIPGLMGVVLVREGHEGTPDLWGHAMWDNDGTFLFRTVPPGKYRLFATSAAGKITPDWEKDTVEVEVHAGEKLTVNAPAVEAK